MKRITHKLAAFALTAVALVGAPGLAFAQVAQDEVAMFRIYNPNSGEHFYTQSVGEMRAAVKTGWQYEGVGWWAPTTGNEVYRLYNPNSGDHHYTTSAGERDLLVVEGWSDEGVGWMSGGNAPVYRQYNPNASTGAHNFTKSAGERDALVINGWNDEGVAWYASNVQRGWVTINGERCFIDDDGQRVTSGFVVDAGGFTYYIKEDGTMAQDEWLEINGTLMWFQENGTLGDGGSVSAEQNAADLANLSARQQAIISSCDTTEWPGPGLCATWVNDVFQNAGEEAVWGDACDMARNWCTTNDITQLKPGMIVAVPSHPHTYLGGIYGHVGIYVGNNIVRDSGSYEVRHVSLGTWLAFYGGSEPVKWGWANGINLLNS
ncbi:MAG: hypothetical protein Q4B54_07075 [Coriobacteriales bacterium]|nr:hypothetical protein [Coriobacteriales bacterium]